MFRALEEAYLAPCHTQKKMKFSNKDFFSKCEQIHSNLVTFNEEIFNGKLQFLCSDTKSVTEYNSKFVHAGAAAKRRSVKKVFLEILQNSQESTCARVSF